MNNVMLDIETIGNKPWSAIVSIGAVIFDPASGQIHDQCFHQKINIASCLSAGLKMDTSTVLWWLRQSKEAQAVFDNNESERNMNEVLQNLGIYFHDNIKGDAVVWGCGPSFDQTILRVAYERVGLAAPWKFWNERCVRTMDFIAKQIKHPSRKEMAFDGVMHDALDDAKHQAKFVSSVLSKISA